MDWLRSLSALNLIDVFTCYLILAFVVGTVLQMRNYYAILGVVFTFSHRWPKLLVLAKRHRNVFLRWPTLLPIGLTLALMLGNSFAAHFVWSEATVTVDDLWSRRPAILAMTISGGVMLYLDCKTILAAGRFDRAALEQNLDKAEHWLQSWHAPVVRVLTLGLINPRKIVNQQVLDALVNASLVVNGQMWRWSLQIVMRAAFGLAIWLTWAVSLRDGV
jgi:hypothetical protein